MTMLEFLVEHVSPATAVAGAASALALYVGLFYLFQWVTTPVFPAPLERYKGPAKGNHHFMGLHQVLRDNFTKYRDRSWKIPQPYGEMIMLPLRYVDELRNLPEDQISFREENQDRFEAAAVGMTINGYGAPDDVVTKSVRHDLTRQLNGVMQDIWDETAFAFDTEVGECKDWTPINVYHFTTQAVALISGRVFAGPELNRNPDYLRAIVSFTVQVMMASGALKRYPLWMRGFAARWLVPEMRVVRDAKATMKSIMAPLLTKRKLAMDEGAAPENMTTWNLRNSSTAERDDLEAQAHRQLVTSMVAVHTTSMQTAHVLFDLAARLEYVEPLRAELDAAVAESDTGAALDKKAMPKLRKLDSFMKESQRMNPLGMVTFQRKVMKDITLHDGTVLKRGSHVGVPSSALALDPERFEDPLTFDGLRFAKLREQPGRASRHQFVETGIGQNDMVSFGHGSHACPGRFFANNEMKVIATYMLRNYDIKLPEGQGRPKNIYNDGGMRPDTEATILFRRRTTT